MAKQNEIAHLENADRRYLWHPFTQMQDWMKEAPVIVVEGRDCFLKDSRGNWYLDGVSSLWVNILGHRRKEIDDAIKAQVDRISHSTTLGLSNEPAIRLAERLVEMVQEKLPWSPGPLMRVFYSDNGSTAVEVALKMAFQYWKHRGDNQRNSFLALKSAYHGDTIGAVSVGGVDIFHAAFGPLLFKTHRAPAPYCYRCDLGMSFPSCGLGCAEAMEDILRVHHQEIAAVIVEPLVQAAGGMIMSPAGYLRAVRDLCSRYGVLLICDEVATGFGRTGSMFASEHEQVCPDILCLSKGITGGYLPLAATLCTTKIFEAFLGEFRDLKTFFHGHSYTGNPLGCAAALACLDIFDRDRIIEGLPPKIDLLQRWLEKIAPHPHVGDVRHQGLMAGVELVRDKATKDPYAWEERMGWNVARRALEQGVFIRPLGNIVVIMPPLSISLANLEQLLRVIGEAIRSATE